jgi:hypothetical protein
VIVLHYATQDAPQRIVTVRVPANSIPAEYYRMLHQVPSHLDAKDRERFPMFFSWMFGEDGVIELWMPAGGLIDHGEPMTKLPENTKTFVFVYVP